MNNYFISYKTEPDQRIPHQHFCSADNICKAFEDLYKYAEVPAVIKATIERVTLK